MPSITASQLTAIAGASLLNASDLVDDAELLLAGGRSARAHALAVLALEEIGKHVMTIAAITRSRMEPDYWDAFQSRFNSHRAKLRTARLMIQALRASGIEQQLAALDDVVSEANADQVAKLRGLYVDYDHEGRVLDPRVISTTQAETLTADVRFLVTTLGKFDWGSVSEKHREKTIGVAGTLLEEFGPARAAAVMSEALRMALRTSGESGGTEAPHGETP